MTYYEMMNEKRRSLVLRINYLLRMNDNIIDDEIQKLMDEYKVVRTETTNAYAEVALYEAEVVQSIPVRGTSKVANDWESHYSNLYMAVAQHFQGSYGLKMSAADWDSIRRNFPEPTKV